MNQTAKHIDTYLVFIIEVDYAMLTTSGCYACFALYDRTIIHNLFNLRYVSKTAVKTIVMSEENLSSSENDGRDVATLSELFDKAFEQFNNINKTDEPTNSSKVQVLIVNNYV